MSKDITSSLYSVIQGPGSALSGIKWVSPEGMHITLKFLGEVREEAVPEVISGLKQPFISHSQFDISVSGVGAFPPEGTLRVIWAGVDDQQDALVRLNTAAEEFLEKLGFERERRDFIPHITLGRVKRRARPRGVQELINSNLNTRFGCQTVSSVSLIQSRLTPDGAIYEQVHTWQLK